MKGHGRNRRVVCQAHVMSTTLSRLQSYPQTLDPAKHISYLYHTLKITIKSLTATPSRAHCLPPNPDPSPSLQSPHLQAIEHPGYLQGRRPICEEEDPSSYEPEKSPSPASWRTRLNCGSQNHACPPCSCCLSTTPAAA
jgi:hypothetical protein